MTDIIAVLSGISGPPWQDRLARIKTPVHVILELNAFVSALDFQASPLILLDYSLDQTAWQDCLDEIATAYNGSNHFIVALLAGGADFDFSGVPAAGVIDFLTLDMPAAEIDARLQLLLSRHAALAAGKRDFDMPDSAGEAFWVWNPQTGMVHVSQALRMVMGGGASLRLTALSEFLQHVPEAERTVFRDTLQTVAEEGLCSLYRYRMEDEEGAAVVYTHRLVRISGQNGQVRQIKGVVHIDHPGWERRLPEQAFAQWDQVRRFIDLSLSGQVKGGGLTGIVAVNVDRFKRIAATHSREVSQSILRELEQRFLKHFQGQNSEHPDPQQERPLIARMEGDEYILVFTGIPQIRGMIGKVREILEVASVPFQVNGQDIFLTVSAGISLSPLDGDSGDVLFQQAHSALMHVKGQLSNRYQFYSPAFAASEREKIALESSLRQALTSDELELFYQPQMDLASARITGVEALVRWQHPEFGLMAPGAFLALAEEAGLMRDIGEWVLKRGMRDAASWFRQGFGPIQLSVNLSAGMFKRKALPNTLRAVLEETGFHAGCLTVELTEELVMDDVDSALEAMATIRQWGVRFALDDFGTGYSSLNYLKRLPFDYLKIDRSFIEDLTESDEARAMVRAVIGMGHSLKMKILAEGVETNEQLKILAEENCDIYQGFLCSEAVRAEELLTMLEKERHMEPLGG